MCSDCRGCCESGEAEVVVVDDDDDDDAFIDRHS